MTGFSYRDELVMVRRFVTVLEVCLGGRESNRRVNTNPLDWCYLGILGPARKEAITLDPETEVPDNAEFEEEATAVLGAVAPVAPAPGSTGVAPPQIPGSQDDSAAVAADRREVSEGTRRPPSALGFELLLEPDATGSISLMVDVDFCVFTRHWPTYEEQASISETRTVVAGTPIVEITQRSNVSVNGLRFQISQPLGRVKLQDAGEIQVALDAALETAFQQQDAIPVRESGKPFKVEAAALAGGPAGFAAYLEGLRQGRASETWRMQAHVELRVWPRSDGKLRVGCYLLNQTVAEGPAYQNAFRIIGDARLRAQIEQGTLAPIEILPVPRDYQYDRRVWAVGHNTSVVVADNRRSLNTTALATAEQVRVVTRDRPKASFQDLDCRPLETLGGIFKAMQDFAADWEDRVLAQNARKLDTIALAECTRDLKEFRAEIELFAAGIAALRADPRLEAAFRATNRVFGRLARDYDSWRLFQIVFIVTQLPALAIRESIVNGEYPEGIPRRWDHILDWGDVLWFRTGGGKTEAYLGLTCCAMLFDRLRGKAFGVTAWLRFPLRMLSVQQLQRAMRMIWEAEQERKSLLGKQVGDSDGLRLGYFVGGTTTPNAITDEIVNRIKDPEQAESLRVVPDCPACNARGTVRVTVNDALRHFEHVCSACQTHLPLDVSDDEIYRHLPALIVGTIDKMATVGQQVKYGMLWGGARWQCPRHGYSFGEYCIVFGCDASAKKNKKKRRIVTPYDPAPAFHVQDELHLLQEELGAFAGHYETLVRYCEADLSQRPPKIIAATATIEGFEHQMRHLYGLRGARRFPGRGYDRYESFYAEAERDLDGLPRTGRIFAAFRTTSIHQADAASLCTEILQAEVDRILSKPSDALLWLPDATTEDDVRALMSFYTTTLNYVGSLARGSRVNQRLESAATKLRPGIGRDMTIEYHSSRSSSADVGALVHKVENPPPWDDASFLDAVVATNMISHGVDLERFNLMTLDGVPEETAEYIQASSRSGRKHVGLVCVVLPAYSLRASSIYHRFREYHAHLDRMVSPVPVNRFAKYAVLRTLPGITIGLLYGKYAVREQDQNVKKRHQALRLIAAAGQPAFFEEIKRAYALGQGIYDAGLENSLKATLEDGFERVYGSIYGSHEPNVRDAVRPAPMTSLRDVEIGVPFQPDTDWRLLQWLQNGRE